ncbi:hypothetical protein T492DRAFT_910354 [Pavlovales sp. CCMP2436]|nr:hypothetical protein T492DRAFT_910354 [Pavlovales sp. CCMP2436]
MQPASSVDQLAPGEIGISEGVRVQVDLGPSFITRTSPRVHLVGFAARPYSPSAAHLKCDKALATTRPSPSLVHTAKHDNSRDSARDSAFLLKPMTLAAVERALGEPCARIIDTAAAPTTPSAGLGALSENQDLPGTERARSDAAVDADAFDPCLLPFVPVPADPTKTEALLALAKAAAARRRTGAGALSKPSARATLCPGKGDAEWDAKTPAQQRELLGGD